MNEQFDRALRNHIRDTFDHYDDLMADDGWKKFKKHQNKKKRGLIFWYGLPTGIAAALAFLWLFNSISNETIKPEDKPIAKSEISETLQPFKQTEEEPIKNSVSSSNQEKLEMVNRKKTYLTQKPNRGQQVFTAVSAIVNDRNQIATVKVYQKTLNTLQTDYSTDPSISFKNRGVTEVNTAKQEYLAFNNNLIKSADAYPKPLAEKKEIKKEKNSNFNFAVDANTYYSFTSAGINDDLNLGIGVLSELKLSKRLSINSGISINKQSTIYQNSQRNDHQSFDSPALPNALLSQANKQSFSVPESIETNAKLVGFDIPINIKYNIPLGKAKTFVSTGISSYSLLNQSYANDVSVTNYSLTSAPTTTILRNVEKEKESAFSNFQFARTVNFSFGILYPVSNKNSISVEPFLKYPIAGFGSQDLEIGSGGISFKLNFGK